MGFPAQPQDGPAWDRWQQAHGTQEYAVMDGLMQYDTRPMGQVAPQHQRAPMPHPYLGPAYTAAPMASLAPSPFASNDVFSFNGYGPAPPRDPYRPPPSLPFPDRHAHVAMPPMGGRNGILAPSYRDMRSPFDDQGHSPSSRSDSPSKTLTVPDGELPKVPRTITANATVNPDDEASFSTHVDTVMRAIQANRRTDDIVRSAEDKIRRSSDSQSSDMGSSTHSSPFQRHHDSTTDEDQVVSPGTSVSDGSRKRRANTKKYICDFPGCLKRFPQKTHLDIHRRTHTGEKPYECKHPGCGKRFSQPGNLRTHIRTHTGERPYECAVCGKTFPQRGNVRAHQANVHRDVKPFVCKLESCTKEFTTRGNMKTHHNKFHKEALVAFGQKFANITDVSVLSDADREIWEHLATTYKNSNKGIKGRGKKESGSSASQSPESAALSPYGIDTSMHNQMYAGNPHLSSPQSTLSPSSDVSFSSLDQGGRHNPAMLGGPLGTGMYDAKVGGEVMAAAPGSIYDAHAREAIFHDRGY